VGRTDRGANTSHQKYAHASALPLVLTLRSSCCIAAPTFTNFEKLRSLANLLIPVPLFYLKFRLSSAFTPQDYQVGTGSTIGAHLLLQVACFCARSVFRWNYCGRSSFLSEQTQSVRAMAEVDPTPELPDDTPLAQVEVVSGIREVLTAAGMKTVGDVRETPDGNLLSLPALGKGSLAYLRQQLGLPSSDGVRIIPRKPW